MAWRSPVVAAFAVLWATAASAQTGRVPSAVSPFPRGLSGTLAFQSDFKSADNPDGRIRIYTINLATGSIDALTTARDWDDENPRWSPDGQLLACLSVPRIMKERTGTSASQTHPA